MGAARAANRIQELKTYKQVRNQTNRQTNCDTANLSRIVRSNSRTLKAIRFLEQHNAFESLPETLQYTAKMRKAYPDLSLTALCECFDQPVSKSSLSHRLKKIEAIAESLSIYQQEKE